jgi:hypothetical protein
MGNTMRDEKSKKNSKSGLQKVIEGILERMGEDFQGLLEGLNPGRRSVPVPIPIPVPAPVYRRRRL